MLSFLPRLLLVVGPVAASQVLLEASTSCPACEPVSEATLEAAVSAEGSRDGLQLLQLKARAVQMSPATVAKVSKDHRRGGCDKSSCEPGFACAIKADKSYSQCVPCASDAFERDCGFWDAALRVAATEVCAQPCSAKPLSSAPAGGCLLGASTPEYNSENCDQKTSGQLTMTCSRASPDSCGTRIGSDHPTGRGRYAVDIKAARGDGVATTFYLYTWGEDNSRNGPWSEVDIEILGRMANSKRSLVWTNFHTGPFDKSAPFDKRQKEHPKYIELPFDVTAGFHEFAIDVGDGTLEWLVDGKVYRHEDIHGYPDMMATIKQAKFRTYLALWGQNTTSGNWRDMGFLNNRATTDFPLKAAYKDLHVPK